MSLQHAAIRERLQVMLLDIVVGRAEPFFGKSQIQQYLKGCKVAPEDLDFDLSLVDKAVFLGCRIWAEKLVANLRSGVTEPKYVLMVIISYLSFAHLQPADVGLTLFEMKEIENQEDSLAWQDQVMKLAGAEISLANRAMVAV